MTTTTADYEADCEYEVLRRMDDGVAFEDVEAYIEGLALDPERKSALWLLVWSELPWVERRSIILQTSQASRADSRALRAEARQAKRHHRKLLRDQADAVQRAWRLRRRK